MFFRLPKALQRPTCLADPSGIIVFKIKNDIGKEKLLIYLPHLILNTFYQPNKPNKPNRTNPTKQTENRTKIVDRVYLELNEEHFLKKRLKIGPTIQEILDFKVSTSKFYISC